MKVKNMNSCDISLYHPKVFCSDRIVDRPSYIKSKNGMPSMTRACHILAVALALVQRPLLFGHALSVSPRKTWRRGSILTRLGLGGTKDDDKKNLGGLLQELDQQFDYKGRMEAKTDQDFRCGFVVIIGVSRSQTRILVSLLLSLLTE